MDILKRSHENPILRPDPDYIWEAQGTFNPSVIKVNNSYHMVFRALSSPRGFSGVFANLSTIGYAVSEDGLHFTDQRQIIEPDEEWDKYGCEDPRITKMDDTYYIFYTALSTYPFSPEGIKVGLALTRDLKNIDEKHLVTPFNAKAMALFPQLINGKLAAVLTVNTDRPPAKIGLAFFDKKEEIWSKEYWDNWYKTLDNHILNLQRSPGDQIEAGAVPVATQEGWILFYAYIRNYNSRYRVFGVEVVRLALDNPQIVSGKITDPLLIPEKGYELYGNVPNVVFPTGAVVDGNKVDLYYGAADTTCCIATGKLDDILKHVLMEKDYQERLLSRIKLTRFGDNPIITPNPKNRWESKFTFNPAAIFEGNMVHLVYRAMSADNTSVFGYAASSDGFHIDKRLTIPIYFPREDFEIKKAAGNSGCEDPRIVHLEERLYMCYTAYDGKNPPRVALTSILADDFVNNIFNFSNAVLISPPDIDDKDASLFPEKINGKYVILHRFDPYIWIDTLENLTFGKKKWIKGKILFKPRIWEWDSGKVGLGPPPIKTEAGWLLIYHGMSREDKKYRLGAALLEGGNPENVLARLSYPILEPEERYENEGLRPGTVFSCGAVVLGDQLYVYYGGGDSVVCAATVRISKLLDELKKVAG